MSSCNMLILAPRNAPLWSCDQCGNWQRERHLLMLYIFHDKCSFHVAEFMVRELNTLASLLFYCVCVCVRVVNVAHLFHFAKRFDELEL